MVFLIISLPIILFIISCESESEKNYEYEKINEIYKSIEIEIIISE